MFFNTREYGLEFNFNFNFNGIKPVIWPRKISYKKKFGLPFEKEIWKPLFYRIFSQLLDFFSHLQVFLY